jgi:hypothetical protein
MKTPSERHPTKLSRWVHERAADTTSLDAELRELFRALPPAASLAPALIAAVGRRLVHKPETVKRRSLRYLPLAFAVLVGTAGAIAQWAPPGAWRLQHTYVASPRPANVPSVRSAVATTTASAPVVPDAIGPDAIAPDTIAPDAIAAEPSLAAALQHSVAAEPMRNLASSSSSGSKAHSPSQLALEAEALQPALAKLRRSHDAKAALRLLDDYQARFPRGYMSIEAGMARVDALLLLGQRAEALILLAGMPLDRVGRGTELKLVRAELYAERDCRRALADFNTVLAVPASAGLTERALYGRAGCSLRLGNAVAARADLTAYLARYPGGRFAGQVRARLASD